jgi:hypothetical protein
LYRPGFDRELRNQKKRTQKEFLKFITELGSKITDSTLTKEQQNALFNPIVAYAHKEQADLTRLRKKYFKKIQAPPSVLNAFIFDSELPAELSKMLGTPQFTTITLLQCYRPIEIGRLISGIIQPGIYQQSNTGTNEATIAYTFGNQVFAKQLKEDIWQIWLVNRLYMLSLTWIYKLWLSIIRNIRCPIKRNIYDFSYRSSIQKPANELETLSRNG